MATLGQPRRFFDPGLLDDDVVAAIRTLAATVPPSEDRFIGEPARAILAEYEAS